jgi:TRAP-type C4-dicarboxylate transport system permease small subunit
MKEMPAWLRPLLWIHDWITRIGFYAASLGLMAMCGLYCMEVVLRYFLNAPTTWSTDVITFILLFSTFAAIPYAVKQAMHVSVTIIIDMWPASAPYVGAFINIFGIVLCGFVGYIAYGTSVQQYVGNIETSGSLMVDKWFLTAFISYGFINSALWHIRLLLTGQSPIQSEIAAAAASSGEN